MPPKERTQFVGLGAPAVPLIPHSHFTKFDKETIETAWHLVGPSVAKNLGYYRPAPLWTIFAACYAEGLLHGAGVMQEKMESYINHNPMKEET